MLTSVVVTPPVPQFAAVAQSMIVVGLPMCLLWWRLSVPVVSWICLLRVLLVEGPSVSVLLREEGCA